MKLNTLAILPLLAILAGCGGKGGDNPLGPSVTPTTTSGAKAVSDPQVVIVTSDGATPTYTKDIRDGWIFITASGYMPRAVPVSGEPTQTVQLQKIPSPWDSDDVIDLHMRSVLDPAKVYPLAKLDGGKSAVIVPAAGTPQSNIDKMAWAAAYMSGGTGYDFHMVAPGESTTGNVPVEFIMDQGDPGYNGTTWQSYRGNSIIAARVNIWTGANDDTYAHELGHVLGLGHLRKQRGLMGPGSSTLRTLTSQEVAVIVNDRVYRMVGLTAPDNDSAPASRSAVYGTRTFVCGH